MENGNKSLFKIKKYILFFNIIQSINYRLMKNTEHFNTLI